MASEARVWTIPEVAARLGLARNTAYRLAARGRPGVSREWAAFGLVRAPRGAYAGVIDATAGRARRGPMAVAMLLEWPGATIEQYDAVIRDLDLGGKSYRGGIFHVAGPAEGG